MDVRDFQADVIEQSRMQPVVTDFWAPWCGPCRILSPVLEKLEAEAGGAWRLAKLNTDEDPTIASRYGISGIPAVKMFVDGNVVGEFVGALPETRVRDWLDENLPSLVRATLQDAEAALERGDAAAAVRLADEVLVSEPGNADARLLKARAVVLSEPAKALELAREAAAAKASLYPIASAVETVSSLLVEAPEMPEGPARDGYLGGLRALSAGDPDTAVEKLIDSIRRDKRYADDAARKAVLALFSVLGERHPVTRKHRRSLQMALF